MEVKKLYHFKYIKTEILLRTWELCLFEMRLNKNFQYFKNNYQV